MVEKGLLGGVVEICRINIVLRAWVVDWLFLKGVVTLTDHKRMDSTMVCGPIGGIYPYPFSDPVPCAQAS